MNELVEAIGGKTGYDITLNRLLVFIDCARRKYQDGHAKLGEWINTVIRRIITYGEFHMMALPLCSYWNQILSYSEDTRALEEKLQSSVFWYWDETTKYLKFPKRAKKCKWLYCPISFHFFLSFFVLFFSFFLYLFKIGSEIKHRLEAQTNFWPTYKTYWLKNC